MLQHVSCISSMWLSRGKKCVGEGRGGGWTWRKSFVSVPNPHMHIQRQHLTGQSLRCMKPTGKSLLESVEKSVFHGVCK